MIHIKKVNEYNKDTKQAIDFTRKFQNNKIVRGVGDIASVIDDILHLDFKSLVHSFTNREGYNKMTELMFELGLLKSLIKRPDWQEEDIVDYDIDVSKILTLLQDEDVDRYLETDSKLNLRFNKRYRDLIKWLEEKENESK